MPVKITGIPNILRNLVKAKKGLGKELERGLKKAGLNLQRDSQKIVPIDTSNLKNSAFTRKEGGTGGLGTVIWVGYTAGYAIYVHENMNARHRTGKIAKYLEKPARENRIKYGKIVAKEMGG